MGDQPSMLWAKGSAVRLVKLVRPGSRVSGQPQRTAGDVHYTGPFDAEIISSVPSSVVVYAPDAGGLRVKLDWKLSNFWAGGVGQQAVVFESDADMERWIRIQRAREIAQRVATCTDPEVLERIERLAERWHSSMIAARHPSGE